MQHTRIKYSKNLPTAFFPILKQRIAAYFEEKNIAKQGQWRLLLKSVVSLGTLLVPYFILLFFDLSDPIIFLLFGIMGVGMTFIGMHMMHEGCHGAYHSNRWINLFAANTMYLVGGDKTIWLTSHNVLHHSYTNIYGHDVDLEAGNGIIRLTEHAEWQAKHRYQHIYAFFLYSLLTLTWVFLTDYIKLRKFRKRKVLAVRNPDARVHWFRLIAYKILSYTFWLVIPLFLIQFAAWKYLLGFLLMHLVAGIILTLVFQLAHLTEEAEMPQPNESGNMEHSWAVHQLETTANWGTHNSLWNWFTGGLNHQIEHHLFPGISHVHYPAIAPIVKETAKEFGLPYHEFDKMSDALKAHYDHLKEMGKKPEISSRIAVENG